MSQRLLVGRSDQVVRYNGYDAVLTEREDHEAAVVRVWKEWFGDMGDGFYVGPWKMRVLSAAVFRQHEAAIRHVFRAHRLTFPEDLLGVYDPNDTEVEIADLDAFLDYLARQQGSG